MKKNFKKFSILVLCFAMVFSLASVCFAAEFSKDTPVSELDGKELGVQEAVLYEEMMFDRVPNANWNYFKMPNDSMLALMSNKISAYLIEEVSFYVQKANHPELVALDEYAGVAEYAIMVGDREGKQATILSQINEFIAQCQADGTSEEMYEYWIKNFDPDTSTCDLTNGSGEAGELRIAIEGGYEPFSYESYGDFMGFDVDFMLRFCRQYGYEAVFYAIEFDAIATGCDAGKYDCGMNIVVSEERSDGAVLSDVYYDCPIMVIVLGDETDDTGFFAGIADSFYKTFIKENRWELFLDGIGETLLITICSIVFGTLLGFGVYLVCKGGKKLPNKIAGFFNWLIEGMPTVLLLMILYYIVFGSTSISGMWVSVIGFTLIFACCMFDMLKVGFDAIDKGQYEAATALGYSDKQSFFRVLLPQAARHFLPIYKNDIVTLIKETSVVGYIAVMDLTKISDLVRSRTYDPFFPLVTTAIIYFVVAAIMTAIVNRIEFNIDPKKRPKGDILKGIEEQE